MASPAVWRVSGVAPRQRPNAATCRQATRPPTRYAVCRQSRSRPSWNSTLPRYRNPVIHCCRNTVGLPTLSTAWLIACRTAYVITVPKGPARGRAYSGTALRTCQRMSLAKTRTRGRNCSPRLVGSFANSSVARPSSYPRARSTWSARAAACECDGVTCHCYLTTARGWAKFTRKRQPESVLARASVCGPVGESPTGPQTGLHGCEVLGGSVGGQQPVLEVRGIGEAVREPVGDRLLILRGTDDVHDVVGQRLQHRVGPVRHGTGVAPVPFERVVHPLTVEGCVPLRQNRL